MTQPTLSNWKKVPPRMRGLDDEQATMFFLDLCGNAFELKVFVNPKNLL